MSITAVTNLFAGVAVADRDAALPFYEQLMGRPPDLIPNPEEAAWQLTGSGWIYIYEDPRPAGAALQTLLVEDLDGVLGELASGGLQGSPIEQMSNGVRTSTVTDPEGNRIKLGQVPAGA